MVDIPTQSYNVILLTIIIRDKAREAGTTHDLTRPIVGRCEEIK
jgi:hypothetical protein